MLTTFVNTLMSAEADAVLRRPCGMPSPDRVNVHSGYRHRDFDTRAGTLNVAIPELGSGSYFPGLDAGTTPPGGGDADDGRGDVLPARGVDAADGEAVESLGIARLSKSEVSVMAAELDAAVEDFRTRPLDAGPYTFVAADALVLKVTEGRGGHPAAFGARVVSRRGRMARGKVGGRLAA